MFMLIFDNILKEYLKYERKKDEEFNIFCKRSDGIFYFYNFLMNYPPGISRFKNNSVVIIKACDELFWKI
jgi:hypothetical protein